MAVRGIFKNISTLSFAGYTLKGVKNFTFKVECDVDRDLADNETDAIIFGTQNYRGNASAELGDIKDITGQISVGQVGSLRGGAVAKYSSTETDLVMIFATAYCVGIDIGVPHGSPAAGTITWEFNTSGLSYG